MRWRTSIRRAPEGKPQGGATGKSRLDQLLVDRGLAENKSRAQALIMAGLVYSGEQRAGKPGASMALDAPLEVRGKAHPWVSRGGMKLDHALDFFHIDVSGLTCLDLGASTGGFTDVLLSRGAARVFAVDVGRGQLDWKLRKDDRVTVLERTDARHLGPEQINAAPHIITADASFISLEKLLPAPLALAGPGAHLIALIKPQFDVGKAQVGKGGVVRDQALHEEVQERISDFIAGLGGWRVLGITESPITGPKGNKEFLIGAVLED